MITEFILAGSVVYGYNYLVSNERKIKKIFKDTMENNCLDYKIEKIKEVEYGYELIIDLYGVGFEKLEKAKDVLETAYGEKIFIVQNDNLKTATISIITYKIDESTRFKPIETKPYEIFAGYSYKAEPLISNLNKFPHVLVSGQTGCGKTELIRLIITNNIHNYSDRDFNIYFSDLSDSCDFDIFKNCKQTKGYSETLEDSEKLFEHLIHVYKKRLNIFSKNSCKNIIEYNNKNFNKRMSYIWVVLDEFADYFPTNRLDKEYMQKVNCYNLIKNLVRKARKVGMFLLIGIQRPDTTVLDPSLKSCLCTKFGFSQNNDASSLVVCDSVELSNIDNREALFMYGNKREWFKTLYIDNKLIDSYIKDSKVYYNKDYNSFIKNKEKEKVKNKCKLIPQLNKKSKSKVKLKDVPIR
ncbi:FtsK/SpoIIIE domain-containing protein [Clostridium botulinum]|uniref:FtsK/SpoIIIE domain-containing protein n=2 Tax=Clostridium botulinum TaxID=1491 RepID=UPI0005183C6C|nr:FtsK/SpoIIIE domain-containing protein [Clostridium botulinum]MBY6773707.1 hypothetical protein [Clostridium botulinum]MBY6864251.1 hypothetical protein [Clostridium botulinum]MBY6984805.1 hypothetical protein [Clostridium botulinum]NFP26120.1 hypothetical protein [Clostridium botulinum]